MTDRATPEQPVARPPDRTDGVPQPESEAQAGTETPLYESKRFRAAADEELDPQSFMNADEAATAKPRERWPLWLPRVRDALVAGAAISGLIELFRFLV